MINPAHLLFFLAQLLAFAALIIDQAVNCGG